MQQTKTVEIATGAFVALGFAALFFLTTQTTNVQSFDNGSYEVSARFDNIGGLKVRSPVAMSGVRIGYVSDIEFDPVELNALVTLRIDSRYDQLPDDSDASILTAGLLGSQYVGLQAGGSDLYLEEGSELLFTQSAIVLESLIGKFLVNSGSDDE
ncbi:MAG: outer membrane lipid asymmetry maintenance protein MlaD [Pseudomonadota bacterium]